MTERPPLVDVRMGSSTDARPPISPVERPRAATSFQWLGLLTVGLASVAADQLTKHLVASKLELGESVHVIGPFYLHHVKNPGIAFGLFPSAATLVTILTSIAVLLMLVYFARSGARHTVLPVALGFLVGGSLSNLVDRARSGHVTDFLAPQHWPEFNLADAFITIGVAILLLALAASERRSHVRRLPSAGG